MKHVTSQPSARSFRKNAVLIALQKSLITGAILAGTQLPAFAQQDVKTEDSTIERINVTGSSIKRANLEGPLPIVHISAQDIARSGVTSVPDLIQQIPAMQGFETSADAVGAGNNGAQTASLRDLGSSYTLVLLNGRRMASQDSGGSVDISSIPLAAVERVEILMDGASALYGSDAIAGVINFILKQDVNATTITARYDKPQESGGESVNFSLTTGFGDLSSDGFNVMLSYSHKDQAMVRSLDRDFADTGIVPFSYNGEDLVVQRTSSSAIPANLYLRFDNSASQTLNPYQLSNGECAAFNELSGKECLYDFTEDTEISPELKSDNFLLSGVMRINDNTELFSTVMYSDFSLLTRAAAQNITNFQLDVDSPFAQNFVEPLLTPAQFAELNRIQIKWRSQPAGKRTNEYATTTINYVAGIRGDLGDASYNLALSSANSERDRNRTSGYLILDDFEALLNSGTFNVFTPTADLSAAEIASIENVNFQGLWSSTKTTTNSIEGNISAPVFDLPAGDVYLGAGFDYRDVSYKDLASQANKDEVLFNYTADVEYDLSRETYGAFVEAIVPVLDNLEITGALRYDNIGGVSDAFRAPGEQKVNDAVNDTTYKLSLSYRPTNDLLIRASVGTGFKAATMVQIASPKSETGSTDRSYECPFNSSHEYAQYCETSPWQLKTAIAGNEQLKPETSEQMSLGFVYSPSKEFNVNIDWWQIDMEDQIKSSTEAQIIGDSTLYANLYGLRVNPQSGELEIEITTSPINIGKSNNQGIDWSVTGQHDFSFGEVKSTIRGAYMLVSESLRTGTVGIYDSSLGEFGLNDQVTFPHIIKWSTTLTKADFSHSLNFNYKSGYEDAKYAAGDSKIRQQADFNLRSEQDIERRVSSYLTADYVTNWNATNEMALSFGIKNLFDRAPPLSLRTAGGGNQVGYDPRYTDQFGRTFYLKASYTF